MMASATAVVSFFGGSSKRHSDGGHPLADAGRWTQDTEHRDDDSCALSAAPATWRRVAELVRAEARRGKFLEEEVQNGVHLGSVRRGGEKGESAASEGFVKKVYLAGAKMHGEGRVAARAQAG